MDWSKYSVLVTGGTGSFGRKFAEILLSEYNPRKLIIFSRDELKQHEMRTSGFDKKNVRYFLGDVRNPDRLVRAFRDVDIVVHAAALKQVPACEYNPFEAVMTNVIGAKNIVNAAVDTGVKKVLALSTDKAVAPINLYGATKLVAEKIFTQGNFYSGDLPTCFSSVRYGNVVGSRGSVIPLFLDQRKKGRITITDERMTRFWLTLERGVRFVIKSIELMKGGEVFIPTAPSMNIMELAKSVAPECEIDHIGIRPGEKLHEILLSEAESLNAYQIDDMYILYPHWADERNTKLEHKKVKKVPQGFEYRSDSNEEWLSKEELSKLL